MSSLSVIIPAAGSGTRMKSEVPKSFIKLGQKTVLEHTVCAFLSIPIVQRIIIATSDSNLERVRTIFSGYKSKPEIICGKGGALRRDSVNMAMRWVGDVELVAVHDAARPFVTQRDIMACCEAALTTGAAILAVKASDTIKKVDESGNIISTLDRNGIWLAQTPQIFRKEILVDAYLKGQQSDNVFTDDASLVEFAGYPVKIIPGDVRNIKLTYPDDLKRAQYIMKEVWKS
ncbi:MAG: 2-C-methyl-D-erythritol 4-phosphate cytidylyltransferase [Balneolales bacterium]